MFIKKLYCVAFFIYISTLTISVNAKDYYLLMFSTDNCKYCDLAESDFQQDLLLGNRFKDILKLKVTQTLVVNPNNEAILTNRIDIKSFNNKSLYDSLFNLTDKSSIIRAGANVTKFPTFTVVSTENGQFSGMGSIEGYPSKSLFLSKVDEILKQNKKVSIIKRILNEY